MRKARSLSRDSVSAPLYLVEHSPSVSRPKRIKRKTPKWFKVAISLLGVYLVFLFGMSGYEIWQLKKELNSIEQEQVRLLEHKQQLEKEIESLNDPEVVEKIARESLGMVRQGETVVIPAVPGYDLPEAKAIVPGEIMH